MRVQIIQDSDGLVQEEYLYRIGEVIHTQELKNTTLYKVRFDDGDEVVFLEKQTREMTPVDNHIMRWKYEN